MKVLLILTSGINEDFEAATYNHQELGIAKMLMKHGWTCDIATYSPKGSMKRTHKIDEEHEINVYYLSGKIIAKVAFYDDYTALSDQYDLLVPIEYSNYESAKLVKRYPDKTILYHGSYYHLFNKRYNLKCAVFDLLLLRYYRKYNTPAMAKSAMAADFLRNKGLTNVTTIGVGIDIEQLVPANGARCAFADQLREIKTSGKDILLYIGRIEPRRNILFLLDVFNAVHAERPDTVLAIVGKGKADYKARCVQYAHRLNIADSIVYTEAIEQHKLASVYSEASAFLLPTIYEIFGMVLLEAMFFKLPVLTTRNGGSSTLIHDGKDGLILNDFSVEDWKNAVISLLKDKAKAKRMGESASENIRANYTWDALGDAFISACSRVAVDAKSKQP